MICSSSVPKILFIKSVFKKDCFADDILELKISEHIQTEKLIYNDYANGTSEISQFTYDKLPTLYESDENWPQSTNLLCCYCSLVCRGRPVFIPTVFEPVISRVKMSKYSIGVLKVFGSFGCAWMYIEKSNWKIQDKIEYKNKLKMLHKLWYDKDMPDIVGFPDPHNMVQYGGNMSIAEFKAAVDTYRIDQELTHISLIESTTDDQSNA